MSDEDLPGQRRAWRTDDEWSRLRERMTAVDATAVPKPARVARYLTWLSAAGIAAVAATLLSHRPTAEPVAPYVVTTPAGQRMTVRLADSSVVTLGPSSRMSYVATATGREVRLEGLAAFKVAHDAKRPFVVRARNAVATDIGTEFVVRAYNVDSSVQVAVTSGEVSLSGTATTGTATAGIALRAGDVGRVNPVGAVMRAPESSAATDAAWVDGTLVFDNETVAKIAVELSRWFDMEIRVASPALAAQRRSAVYNSPSLDGTLSALTATLDARVERTGRTITILPRAR